MIMKSSNIAVVFGRVFLGGATLLSLPFRFLVQLNLVLSQAAYLSARESWDILVQPASRVQSYYFEELSFAEERLAVANAATPSAVNNHVDSSNHIR